MALKDKQLASHTLRTGAIGNQRRPALLSVICFIACLTLAACQGEEESADASETARADGKDTAGRPAGRPGRRGDGVPGEEAPPVPVNVAQVRRGTIEAYYEGSTNLTAAEEAVVVARTQGVVEALYAEEGDVVKAGQSLAQLETERLNLELAGSRAQLDRLKTAYERAQRMFEAKMISPNDHDDAKFAFEAEETNLRLREYELKEATIRATIDGVITRRHIKVGHTLNQNAPAFEMKRLDVIEAELNVPEREIQNIRRDQYARVHIDALPDEQFDGTIARVAPEVDAGSGTFRVTVTLANDDTRLRPGMFARVDVRIDQHTDALLVPLEAVVTRRNDNSLFVVEGGVVERRDVAMGYVSDGNVEILNGVAAGEWVVRTGHGGLRNGARVSVVDDNVPLGSG
ncbi:MAG: efflux RND transporter periplasmic adaptor subunit [Gammaproteobacteria bacterium]|nr:efflux RND transporter periplasmic adaptor subunit [Gammaproteobacteria bacterium]